MIREPKTDRPLGIALVGITYVVVALARPGDTIGPPAYFHIRQLFGNEQNFLLACVAFMIVQVFALAVHGWPRLVACLILLWTSLMFGVLIFEGSPVALLPGLALMIVVCNALALFDSFRKRWHG